MINLDCLLPEKNRHLFQKKPLMTEGILWLRWYMATTNARLDDAVRLYWDKKYIKNKEDINEQ